MSQKWYNRIMWTAMLSFFAAFVILAPLISILDLNTDRGSVVDYAFITMVGGGGFTVFIGFCVGGFTGHFRRFANGGDDFRRDVRYVLDKKENDDDSN